MHLPYVLKTKAYCSGFEVARKEIEVPTSESIKAATRRVTRVRGLRKTHEEFVRIPSERLRELEIWGGTPESREFIADVLNMNSAHEVGAVLSRYGELSFLATYTDEPGAEVYKVHEQLYLRGLLRSYLQACEQGNFITAREATIAMDMEHPMEFTLRLSPFGNTFGPVLETSIPIIFAMMELSTQAWGGQHVTMCQHCHRFVFVKKMKGTRFCSARCRVANHRAKTYAV